MKAVIECKLERPTRLKRTILNKIIVAKKDVIKDEVNKFIYERQHKENFIKVVKFNVRIYNYRGNVVEKWSYTPTY